MLVLARGNPRPDDSFEAYRRYQENSVICNEEEGITLLTKGMPAVHKLRGCIARVNLSEEDQNMI